MDSNARGKWIEVKTDKFVKELAPNVYSVAVVKTYTDPVNNMDTYELKYKTINLENEEIDATEAVKIVENMPVVQLEQFHKLGNRIRINEILDSLGVTAYARGKHLRQVGDILEETYVEMENRWQKSWKSDKL